MARLRGRYARPTGGTPETHAKALAVLHQAGTTRDTEWMRTAISVPDGDFDRFERIAKHHGMNRSEFYRRAAERFADELEGESERTSVAVAVRERAGQPADDGVFLREAER